MYFSVVVLVLAICQIRVSVAQLAHERLQRSLQGRTWASETPNDGNDGSGDMNTLLKTCDGCKTLLAVLKGIVKDGDETFLQLGKDLCKTSTDYDEEYCHGVVELEGPLIASIMRSIEVGSKTSVQFCVTFLGVCDVPSVDPWNVPMSSALSCPAAVPAAIDGAGAEKKGEEKEKKKQKPRLQVIHYSDIHIDPLYATGSSSKCGRPTCCRPLPNSDTAGIAEFAAGKFGDHNCDSPLTLEKSMHDFIKQNFPDAAFALFTGDVVDHGLHNTSRLYNENLITHAYNVINSYMGITYGTVGNHEAHPANIFSPQSTSNESRWIYDTLARGWSHSVSSSSLEHAKVSGFYSTKYPKGNLRVISLNTNMYYRYNFKLYQHAAEPDPTGQLAWLVNELQAAERAAENVYIIGHMPMGSSDALPNGSNYFDQIVKQFSHVIRAMFFGHTHLDHFQISYASTQRTHSTALAVSYICPSLTPTSGQPSFRVYDVDADSFAVLDAHTYTANMEDAAFQTSGPVWTRYYSARESYGHATHPPLRDGADLSPAFWHNLTVALGTNETLFDQYMARKTRGWNADAHGPCRHACRHLELCGLRAARSEDNCWRPTPGVTFSKREARQHRQHQCGAPAAAQWMKGLLARRDMREMVQERFLALGARVPPLVRRTEPSALPPAVSSVHCSDARPLGTAVATPKEDGAVGSRCGSAWGLLGLLVSWAAVRW